MVGYGLLFMACAGVGYIFKYGIDSKGIIGLLPLLSFWGGFFVHSYSMDELIEIE